MTGDAEVTNWLNPQPTSKNAKEKRPETQTGIVHLRFKDLSAAEIAAAVSTPSRPFQRIKPAGLASGSVEASWKDTIRNTEARFMGMLCPRPTLRMLNFRLRRMLRVYTGPDPANWNWRSLPPPRAPRRFTLPARFRPVQPSSYRLRLPISANGNRFLRRRDMPGRFPLS